MEIHMCPPHKLVAMIFGCQRTEMAGSRASRHVTSRTSRPESRAPLLERPPATGHYVYQIPRKLSTTFIGLFFERTSTAGLLLPATTLASCATVGWTFCWPFRLRKCFYSSGPAPCQPFFLESFRLVVNATALQRQHAEKPALPDLQAPLSIKAHTEIPVRDDFSIHLYPALLDQPTRL